MNVVFDLDGTLLNTIDDLGFACNYALEKRGYPTHPISTIEAMVGNGINMLIRRALPEEVRTDELVAELRKDFVQYYNAHNCDYTRPYPGIEELLHELKAKGHHLAVASNKYHEATEKIIDHFFPNIFDVVLGEREGIPRKPDPRIVQDILAKMPEIPEIITSESSNLFVGDSLVDRDTARNAKLRFAACSWGFVARHELVKAGIETIVDSPAEILLLVS